MTQRSPSIAKLRFHPLHCKRKKEKKRTKVLNSFMKMFYKIARINLY